MSPREATVCAAARPAGRSLRTPTSLHPSHRFHYSLTVQNNSPSTTVTGNTIAGSLTVTGNTGTVVDTPNEVAGEQKVQ